MDNLKGQRGFISATGLLMMGIAMIFLAVGFIVYPIIVTATDALLAYEYSGLTSITDATFTGFTAVVGVTPLLILIGFVTAGVVVGFLGVRMAKAGISSNLNPMALLMLALSLIFIAVGLIIMPVVLDGVAGNLIHQKSQTDSEIVLLVGANTTANVTLSQTLFGNSVAEVTSVSSNETETPVATSYTTPLLLVSSMDAGSGNRTITTIYDYADLLANYSGLYTVLLITPLLILISFISAAVLTGFFGIKGLRA